MKHFRQHLQANLENDEEFYKGVICTFSASVLGLSELQRKEEDFSLAILVKQLEVNCI